VDNRDRSPPLVLDLGQHLPWPRRLEHGAISSHPRRVIVDSGVELTLAEQAASALNGPFEVSAFKGGQVFGVATMTLAAKA
jgi:hypothetical protein